MTGRSGATHARISIETGERRASAAELALGTVVYLAGAVFYMGPSMRSLAGMLGPDLGDPRLNLYFVSWVAHSLESGLDGLWSPPFFYPTRGVLAFSDHLIGPGVFVWLAGLVGVGRVTAFNLLFVASFVLSGGLVFWLFRRLCLALWPALLGGWFVAFSHWRWGELSHYQVLRAQWIPLVLWCFDRFLVRPRAASAAVFLGAYLLHVSGGTYLTYMIHVPMLVVLVVRGRDLGWSGLFGRARLPWLAGVGVASLAVLAPFVWGYAEEWGSRTIGRQLWEVRSAGAVTASLWAPSHAAPVRSLGFFTEESHLGALFPGLVLLAGCLVMLWGELRPRPQASRGQFAASAGWAVAGCGLLLWALGLADAFTLAKEEAGWLVAIGLPRYNGPRVLAVAGLAILWLAWRRWPRRERPPSETRDPFVVALVAGGAICLWLSLPVGFTTVNRHVPGMSGMRVSHRFFVFALLALAYLGAAGIQRLVEALPGRALRAALLALLSIATVAEAAPRRWESATVAERAAEFPAYAHYLAGARDVTAYLEFPTYQDYRAGEWMHHQTIHWKPLVNGYSARIAGSYRRVAALFDPFPDEAGLERIRAMGVSHVVVHWPARRPRKRSGWTRMRREIEEAVVAGRVEIAFEADGVSVYRLRAGGD